MIRNLLLSLRNSNKPAVISDDGEVSYKILAQKSFALCSALSEKPYEKAAVILPNDDNYISSIYGVLMLGITVMPINPGLTKSEIGTLLMHTDIMLVISSFKFKVLLDAIRNDIPHLKVVYIEEIPPYSSEMVFSPKSIDSDKPMLLLATSGTTTNSKIVQLSENNLAVSLKGYIKCINLADDKDSFRFVLFSPFSTVYGILILSFCLHEAIPLVLTKENFTLDSFYRLVDKYKVTHYEGGTMIPLLMEKTLGRYIPFNLSSLCYITCSGSKIPSSVMESLTKAYPTIDFQQGYGMTEAGPLIAKHYSTAVPNRKPNSVGKAAVETEVFIETSGRLHNTPYVQGEIVVRGGNIMLGYYNNEDETQKVLKNGYLYTGDIGYFDDEEFLYICGRKKNIIIVRGLNVHPEEVEECILSTDMARDCMVYGKSDQWGNEIICADVILNNTLVTKEDILYHCAENLASYKRPHQINIVSEIKKVGFGKTQRKTKGSIASE